jgi:hypothetical protein
LVAAAENVGSVSSGNSARRGENTSEGESAPDSFVVPEPLSSHARELKVSALIKRRFITSTKRPLAQRKSAPRRGVETSAVTKSQPKR